MSRRPAVALLAAALGAGCGDQVTPPAPPIVARLEVFAAESALVAGGRLQLQVAAWDSAGQRVTPARVEWRSANRFWIAVDTSGLVTAPPDVPRGDVGVSAAAPPGPAVDTLLVHVARPGDVKWTFPVSGRMSDVGGPALGPDGTVYALSLPFPGVQNVADVHALTPRGVERWSVRLDRTTANGHLVGPDGTIYVTGRTVRALTPQGAVRWAQVLAGASAAVFITGALAPGGPLVVAGEDSPLALDVATGDTVWAGPVSPIGAWLVPPTIAGGTAWIKKTEDTLYAFSVATGAIGRRIADPDSGVDKRSFGVGPVLAANMLYLPTRFRLAAFDSLGALRWLTDNRGSGVTEPVIDPDGYVYVQTDADGLLALEPATGAWRWRRLAARPRWTWYGGPALAAGGVIYCAALDGFYAYDTSGALRWSYQTTEGGAGFVPFTGAPAIAPDGTVYTYTDTRLYAFWASRPPEPNSPWPMWGHDAQRTRVAR